MGEQVTLRVDRCGDRILRRLEGDEERVALVVDLAAAVRRERRTQDPVMLGQELRVLPPSCFRSRVDPSTSVKRNVTVPR